MTAIVGENNSGKTAILRALNSVFNSESEITTLLLKHGKSVFDFSFSEESDGTKRLFDLIDMLLTDRPDAVFVVDELERSLHPKLTERFLRLFMEAHDEIRMQLVFTTHEDTIMDQSLFRRDEIWFVERDADNASKIYSLDRFKERYEKKLSKFIFLEHGYHLCLVKCGAGHEDMTEDYAAITRELAAVCACTAAASPVRSRPTCPRICRKASGKRWSACSERAAVFI